MSDSTTFPIQQGFAWRGDWKQRLQALLAARGFASVEEFAAAQPCKNFVDLANELGTGDVVAVQLEWIYLDDAERRGAVEQCARDFLVRVLHEYTRGWPRSDDLQARSRLASSLASWSASISSHLPQYKEFTMPMGLALLDEQLPEGWLPKDASDPVLIGVFRKYWSPRSK